MMSSVGIAAWIAHLAFLWLLICGWILRELDVKRIALFAALWLAGRIGLAYVPYTGAVTMFPSYVAILDIVLVFVIFKGNVG